MPKGYKVAACLSLLLFTAGCGLRLHEGAAASSFARPARLSAEGADAAEPSIAAGADGTAYVAWVEHREGGAADVWLAHLGKAGERLNEPARVNPQGLTATA
ncbi:MAG TPA: hypothetical protein VF507_10285, partial [Pyrinomonadaceae bacterium]